MLDDAGGSITITDPSGNVIHLDGKRNITLSAPETITLQAKDIKLQAGNSINIIAQPAEEGGGEGTIQMVAKNNVDIASIEQQAAVYTEQGKFFVYGKEIEMGSQTTAKLIATSTMEIKGSEVEINKG